VCAIAPLAMLFRRISGCVVAALGFCSFGLVTASSSCGIRFERRLLAEAVQTIIAVPLPRQYNSVALVWQDGDAIFLRHMDSDCHSLGDAQEVNRTEEFFHTGQASSGFHDAVALKDGRTAIAWTLHGEIWVRVMAAPGAKVHSSAVIANGPGSFDRREVRLVALNGGGFIAVWSSWKQDGDSWGIFARAFTASGAPVAQQEIQVNQHWQHTQWRPEVIVCGEKIWALWINGTFGPCDLKSEDAPPYCATGPFVRELRLTPEQVLIGAAPEVNVQQNTGRGGPIAATLDCHEGVDVQVYTLYNRGRGFGPAVIDNIVHGQAVDSERRPADFHNVGLQALTSTWWLPRIPSWTEPMSLPSRLVSARLRDSGGSSLGDGLPVSMMSKDGHVVLWYIDHQRAVLQVQLKDYPQKKIYMPKSIVAGISNVHAVWDTTDDVALLFCWVTADDIQAVDPSGFNCVRRPVEWLKPESSLLEFGAKLVLFVVMGGLLTVCCLKYCAQLRLNRPDNRRFGLTRESGQSAAARVREFREQLARFRNLREQLDAIPPEPPEPQPMQDAPEGVRRSRGVVAVADAADELRTCTTAQAPLPASSHSRQWDVCPICQNDVAMRVALLPCGHTACRSCVQELVERQQNCHICRAQIEGFLAVYM